MTEPQHNLDEVCRLLWAMREDELAPEDAERLRSILLEDPHARELYVYYMFLSGSLEWDSSARAKDCAVAVRTSENCGDSGFGIRGSENAVKAAGEHPVGAAVELPHPPEIESQIPEPPFPTLSTTNYPPPTAPFVGSWAFSYMVATVIMGVAILGFWAYKITHYQHIAEAPSQSVPSEARQEMVFVGRITGMVDVKWSDDPHYLPPPDFAHVSLGRKYKLDSGLLEITYDSGAKVILEGPCTYEVESTAGGYLALGKLTAKVGKERSEVRGQRSDHYPLSTTHYPLFSVRTPTAVVTDLGTEFGVKVDENGDVATHVLEGKVEFKVLGDGQRENQTILVSVGESVRLAKGKDGQAATVSLGKANAAAFPIHPGKLAEYVQEQREAPYRRWQAYSRKLRKDPSLVAYYTFESRGRDPTRSMSILPNVAATGEALDGRIDGPRWAEGRFPGKFALRFTGPGWNDRVELPEPERFNFSGAFTVAVWFNRDQFTTEEQALIAKGGSGWRVQRPSGYLDLDRLGFYTNIGDREVHECLSAGRSPDRQWRLAVAVWSPVGGKAVKRLYLDGRLDAEGQSPPPLHRSDEPVWLGNNCTIPDRAWDGLIDEVAIFSRVLSGEEIAEMYVTGKPARSGEPLPKKEASQATKKEASQVSVPVAASRAVSGGIIYSDEKAFDAVVSNPATITFSGLTSNSTYSSHGIVSANGITVAGEDGGGWWAVNNAWSFAGTGREVIQPGVQKLDGIVTLPIGTTAVGMELYAEVKGCGAKFTVTYSDATIRDFTTPVLNDKGTGEPSFWGIVSTNPAVSIASIKMWKQDASAGYAVPVLDLVTAGNYVPKLGTQGKNPSHLPKKETSR